MFLTIKITTMVLFYVHQVTENLSYAPPFYVINVFIKDILLKVGCA